MKNAGWLAVVLAVSGCQVGLYGRDNMPLEESKRILASESTDAPLMGHLDGQLRAVSGREQAKAPTGKRVLTWEGIRGDKACFSVEDIGSYEIDVPGSDRQEADYRRGLWGSRPFVFGARKGFDDLTSASQWPKTKTDITHVDLEITEQHRTADLNARGDGRRAVKLSYRVTMCGRAPQVDADTRYITVMELSTMADMNNPLLFVWAIDGAPNATPLAATPEPAATSTTPTPDAHDAPDASDKSLVATLKRLGRFSLLVQALEAPGVPEMLARMPHFTFFATTDSAFANDVRDKLRAAMAADPEVAKKLVRNLLADKLLPTTELAKMSVVNTVGGYKVAVTHAGKTVKLGGVPVAMPDIVVDHGLLQVSF